MCPTQAFVFATADALGRFARLLDLMPALRFGKRQFMEAGPCRKRKGTPVPVRALLWLYALKVDPSRAGPFGSRALLCLRVSRVDRVQKSSRGLEKTRASNQRRQHAKDLEKFGERLSHDLDGALAAAVSKPYDDGTRLQIAAVFDDEAAMASFKSDTVARLAAGVPHTVTLDDASHTCAYNDDEPDAPSPF